MPRVQKEDFTKLWNLDSACEVEIFEVNRYDESLEIVVGNSYLFKHSDIRNKKKLELNDYWKGLVVGIKVIPSRIDALVQVQWYWSRNDIEASIKGLSVDEKLKEILNVCNRNELFPGKELVINSTDAIEYMVDIVLLNNSEDQDPVFEYFFRLGWDERLQIIQGPSPYGCGKPGCHKLWSPEKQEQRYCFQCSKWYHVFCLSLSTGMKQSEVVDLLIEDLDIKSPPAILVQMAFQPAARGGTRHFAAGNIRIVKKARELLLDQEEHSKWTGGNNMTEEEWISSLEKFFGLSRSEPETDHEKFEREQLVVGCQDIYQCAKCKLFI